MTGAGAAVATTNVATMEIGTTAGSRQLRRESIGPTPTDALAGGRRPW
jgi:hypothetical protein